MLATLLGLGYSGDPRAYASTVQLVTSLLTLKTNGSFHVKEPLLEQ